MQENFQYLNVKAGENPEIPPVPATINFISKKLDSESKASGWYQRFQFRFLIVGAIFYIAWHVAVPFPERLLRWHVPQGLASSMCGLISYKVD